MTTEDRLISANEALRMIRNSKADSPCTDTIRNGVWDIAHDCAISCIDACPTVAAAEVVHGRWLPDMEEFDDDPAVGIRGGVFQTGWKCSICGRSEPTKEPYCNCGAKMSLEEGNNE